MVHQASTSRPEPISHFPWSQLGTGTLTSWAKSFLCHFTSNQLRDNISNEVMDTIILDPTQKSRLDEVARLMLQIYQTLARMKYLDPEWIIEGPHDASDNVSAYRGEIDDSILYLYSILPYVDTGGAMDIDFYDGGEFARFDNGLHVEDGRNPFYAEDEDEMMKPWMTPLSMIGNHETSIIYSARTHSIWIFSQSGFGSVDPGLGVQSRSASPAPYDDESENESEEGEMEDDDYYSKTDCRPASNVLRDINKWYKQLKELPGGGQHSPADWDQALTKPLYVKHGWLTGNFNSDAFQVDRIRSFALREVKQTPRKPFEELEHLQRTAGSEDDISKLTQQVESATTTQAEWDARWKLLLEQQIQKRRSVEIKQQQENIKRLCPGGTTTQREEDMPLWEMEWLRVALAKQQDSLQWHQDRISQTEASASVLDRASHLQLKHAQQEVEIYQQAYEASKLNSERLCPGKTFTSATG